MPSVRRRSAGASRARRRSSGLSPAGFFFWTFFLVASAITYLWIYNQNDQVAGAIQVRQAELMELEDIGRQLKADIDHLSRADRISSIARRELGMVIAPVESLLVYVPVEQP